MGCGDDEEPKEEYLNKESDDDDVLAGFHVVQASTALDAAT